MLVFSCLWVGGLNIVAVLLTAYGFADIYTDLPAGLVGYDSTSEIHIQSAADAVAVRQKTVDYLWGGAGLPTNKLPTSTTVYTGGGTLPSDLNDLNLTSHNAMVNMLEGQPGSSSMRFFLEPVVQGVNKFITTNPDCTDISMIGLSGGGWTTTLAAAIDTRIKTSIQVAGSAPLYMRPYYPGSMGDKEEILSTMYGATTGKASYLDLYTLGSTGAGRKQVQVTNQYDNCCFYGVSATTCVNNTKNAAASTGSGMYEYYLDGTSNVHEITANTRWNVILPTLGISAALPTLPAINEQFSAAAASPPHGWRYDRMNHGALTISSSGGIVTFPAGAGAKSIVHDSSFDIQSKPRTATLKIAKIGGGGYLGMFFSEDPYSRFHDLGLQVTANGALILNSDHGGTFQQLKLTTLDGYQGGPITLTLAFDALGFTASTDFGNYSSGQRLWSSLTSGFSLKDVGMEAFI